MSESQENFGSQREVSAPVADGKPQPFKLDWADTEIRLKDGRFKHFLRRPSPAEVLDYDDKLKTEIPIGKDGSYHLSADAETETRDAEFYDSIKVKDAEGYGAHVVPASHKSAAIQALYNRSIFIDDDADVFASEVEITEIIGDVDNPSAVIVHRLRQPDEKALKAIRNAINNGKMAPDKRGRRKFVTAQWTRKGMAFYREHFAGISGAQVEGRDYSDDLREAFINAVDPIIQKRVTEAFVRELTDLLSD